MSQAERVTLSVGIKKRDILMESIVELFCQVDDFWQAFQPDWYQHLLRSGTMQRQRRTQLCESEVMTIMILFHESSYRHFKGFYTHYVRNHLSTEFPHLVSYNRFVRLMKRVGIPLFVYLRLFGLGNCTGVSFVDSTPIKVCDNRRIERHRVFKEFAARGKTSMGWFYGFKLHLVVNNCGEMLDFRLTPGNVHDTKPLPELTKQVFGKLFGDKGYLSKPIRDDLRTEGIELITSIRRNMKPQLLQLVDKLWLHKRSVIETINDQLKHISQIEHTRQRSVDNFFVNLMAGLIAYSRRPNKPSVQVDGTQLKLLVAT
jgi:hypothetical protein